jgi:ABC-2 type transport system permease protein
MIVLDVSAASRVLTEILNFNNGKIMEKGTDPMKNEHSNNLIIISVNGGYTESVMHVARKAGANGGTVIKGRLADMGSFAEFVNTNVDSEREILCIFAPQNVSKQIMEDVKANISMSTYTMDESGEEKITSSEVYMIISMILSIIIYMFIAMFSGMVMQSVIEEKASRVVEVLVSSVKATELMFGKIIGVACVALTQFFLWIVLTLVLVGGFSAFVGFDSLMGDPAQTEQMMEMTAQMGGVDMAEMTAAMQEEEGLGAVLSTLKDINWVQMIFAFIIYFALGYLLYASLFAAIGSAVENEADTTQLQMPITLPLMLAFFIALYAFNAPDSQIVWWGSMIPFTSPIVMLARIPFGVPMWELALSIALLVMTFGACGWLSAKIYKIGILMFGKKTTFKDLWKWLRQN